MATINGDGGDNTLTGGIADDTISGLAGDDTITGAAGNDSLVGGTGNDLLVGDGGADPAGNLIANGTFDDNSAWTVIDGNSDGQLPLFLQNLIIFNAGGRPPGDMITQTFDSANGALHNVSLDLIENDGGIASHSFLIQILDDQGNIIASETQTVNDGSVQNVAFSFTAVSDTSSIVITNTAFSGNTNGSDGKVDNVSITLDDPSLLGNNDRLEGDGGDDTLLGGEGADSLDGGADEDAIFGGGGADAVSGGTGADTIDGDAGNDTIDGGDGANLIQGGAGNDDITSGVDADTVSGGIGDDSLTAGGGADTITGGDGNDTINAGDGNDFIDGDGNGTVVHTIQEEGFENPTNVVEGADSFAQSYPAGTSPLENFTGTAGFFRDSNSAPQFPNAIAADDGTFYSGLHSDGDSIQEVVSLQLDQPLEAGEDHSISFLAHVMIHGGATPNQIFQQPGSFSILGVSAESTASNNDIAPANGTTSSETIAAHPDVDLLGTTPVITSSTEWTEFVIDFTATRSYDQILFVPNDEGNGAGSFLGIDDIQLTTELTDDTDLGLQLVGGDDLIDAGAGDDTVIGNFGNDTIQGDAGNDSLQGDGGDTDTISVAYTPTGNIVFSYATGANVGDGTANGFGDLHTANVSSNDVSDLQLIIRDGNLELQEGETISFSFTDENGTTITVNEAVVQQTAFANPAIEGTGILTATGLDQNGNETALLLQFNENDGSPPDEITAGGLFFDNDTEPDAFNGANISIPAADVTPLDFDDSISGGDDNDTIDGQFGDDTLAGDGGDDTFFASTGTDGIDGGAGTDTYDVTSSTTLTDGVADTTTFAFDSGDLGWRTFDQDTATFQDPPTTYLQ
ncbi:MAG: calcium-binding protein [Pikeienuella sp.]